MITARRNSAGVSFPEQEVLRISKSGRFLVKPGLGAFVYGYSLIFSLDHVLCARDLDAVDAQELSDFVSEEIRILRSLTGSPVIFFEHGSESKNHITGCYDHLHIHLLPLQVSILDDLIEELGFPVEYSQDFFARTSMRASSYIMYGDISGKVYYFFLDRVLRSQTIRQICCQRLGIPDAWDWALYPNRDCIASYVKSYRENAVVHD